VADVRVMVLRAPGTNCEREAHHAWQLAGASPVDVHIGALREAPKQLFDYQILTLPGGFSYGDDISAGRVFAAQIERSVGNSLHDFVARGGLILGICNGFQVLAKLGILPFRSAPGNPAICTVTYNDPAGFQDRWVAIRADVDHCPFLEKGRVYEMPIAHGEGRVVFADDATRTRARDGRHFALRYVDSPSGLADGPANPNGSEFDLAGLCDETGRVLGLMPHPDRYTAATQHPAWTRRSGDVHSDEPGDGLAMFVSAVKALR
jgi:phosphoribosylformylglycinamidine synthase I